MPGPSTGGTLQETHFGIVTDNRDPDQRGRLKVRSQSLVSADAELPDWLEPAAGVMVSNGKAGALFLPAIGSTVELIVDVHDLQFDEMPGERFLQNPNIKWRPGTYTDSKGPMPLPPDLAKNYPNRRGFVTPAGHKVIMDDKGGLQIISKDGAIVLMDTDGSIKINNPTLLGTATDLMVLGQAFMTLYNNHTHPTGIGPTGTPVVPMSSSQLSQNGHKVG